MEIHKIVDTNLRPFERVISREVHLQLQGAALPRGARLRSEVMVSAVDAVDEISHLAGA
eukprot:COSAG02_NODE_69_length_42323_cov_23.507850_35_plen_59_part_00